MPKRKYIISPKWTIKKEDLLKWAKNAFIFSVPAIIVLVSSFQDIIPQDASYGVVVLYIINIVIDFLRKFAQENRYEAR